MNLLQRLGLMPREEIVAATTPPAILPPAPDVYVSESTALGLGDVYRAIQILGVGAMQLTLDVWRGRDRLDPSRLIRRPDVRKSLSAWIAENVHSLATTGNAFWRIRYNSRNEPINIEVLDPHMCALNDDGTMTYDGRTYPRREFRHLALMRIPGKRYGLGPIQAARVDIAGSLDLRNYAAEFFNTGDVPTGVLSSEQHLTPDKAAQYREQWEARDKHSIAVLGAGLSYEAVMLSPEDAQFIQSRQFSKTGIATLFGIPARLLLAAVEGGSMTYANIAQDDLTAVRWTLMAYLREIEEEFTDVLAGLQTVRFNLDALTRPDTMTRYQAHKIAIDAGFMDVDEVREIEGLPPRPTMRSTTDE